MEEKIIDFETAELAKEKGFDWETDKSYIERLEYSFEDRRKHEEVTMDYIPPRILPTKYEDKHLKIVCSAPTQSLLQKWLRDEHDILVLVDEGFFNLIWKIIIPDHELPQKIYSEDNFNTYEKALEEGLQKALKLI